MTYYPRIVEHKHNGIDIEVKRFNLPYTVETHCPKCNKRVDIELDRDQISYPTVDRPFEVFGYCRRCDCDVPQEIVIRLDVELVG